MKIKKIEIMAAVVISVVLVGAVYFVPLSFAALSLILLTTRLIIPIWNRTIRSTKASSKTTPETVAK